MSARLLSFTMALVAIVFAGCKGSPSREEHLVPLAVNFERSDLGKLPRDFTTALTGRGGPVSWVLREDASAPEGKPVLVQETWEAISYRFPLCIYDKVFARDVAAEVKWKPVSGKVDEAGGIVLRYRPENYYIARANALEDNVILFKTVRGKRSKIEEVPVKVGGAGHWHTLRFEAKGTRLKIIFEGQTVIDRDDHTFSNSGQVGIWTKADSISEFADFNIQPAP